jgi:hypothetical protein
MPASVLRLHRGTARPGAAPRFDRLRSLGCPSSPRRGEHIDSFDEALAAITARVTDYSEHRPHDGLRDRIPAEGRAEALTAIQTSSLTLHPEGVATA